MTRVEFTLSMPGRSSWNGRWSGEDRHYAIVQTLPDRRAGELLGPAGRGSWGYSFGDGWFASVDARAVPKGERLRKSAGFCGYDWMVRSIVTDGAIYGPSQPKPTNALPAPTHDGGGEPPLASPSETREQEVSNG